MITVHILRNTGIVGIEMIWVCFPNLIFINYITSENYLTLLRFLFLSCRTEMAKHYLFRRLKRGGTCYCQEREYIFITVPQDPMQHLPMRPFLFLLYELCSLFCSNSMFICLFGICFIVFDTVNLLVSHSGL